MRKHDWLFYVGMIAFALLVLGCVGIALIRPINKVTNIREVIVTVTDKDIRNNSDDGKYLVYTVTEDGEIEVFEITDSLFKFRFNSSDVYAGIEVGKTYKFTVGGSRIRLLSWYPNIYSYKVIEE